MAVRKLTTSRFRQEVLNSDVPVVVDFYADWCGPCKQVSPAVEALAREWDGEVAFAKVDIEAEPEVARAYRVSSIPAILLFEDGKPTHWSLGAKPGYVIEKELGLARRRKQQLRGDAPDGFFSRLRAWWGGQ